MKYNKQIRNKMTEHIYSINEAMVSHTARKKIATYNTLTFYRVLEYCGEMCATVKQ